MMAHEEVYFVQSALLMPFADLESSQLAQASAVLVLVIVLLQTALSRHGRAAWRQQAAAGVHCFRRACSQP